MVFTFTADKPNPTQLILQKGTYKTTLFNDSSQEQKSTYTFEAVGIQHQSLHDT